MDFVIGRIPPPSSPSDRKAGAEGQIEAQILDVRRPRRRRDGAGDAGEQRRPGSKQADPPGASVLVLLVPDGHKLPDDLSEGGYRIFLRLAKK